MAKQSDPVMDKAHARGPPDQSDFPAEGEGTESPEMSGGLQNRRKIIERPPGRTPGMDLTWGMSSFPAQKEDRSTIQSWAIRKWIQRENRRISKGISFVLSK